MMFIRTNCDRKSQFSGLLTEPLNPCESELKKKYLQDWDI